MSNEHPPAVSPPEDAVPPVDLDAIKAHLPPPGFWSHPWERTMHVLIAEIDRLRALHAPSVLAAPDGRLRALIEKWRHEWGWNNDARSAYVQAADELEATLCGDKHA